MATAEMVLEIAQQEVGSVEEPVNRTKYGQWYGMDGNPWCAMFVSFCLHSAGMPLPITTERGFAFCPFGVAWFKSVGRWLTDEPMKGDVVFFDWNGDGTAQHVGLVESVNPDGSVVTIEGNTSTADNSNGGQVMRRRRARRTILGFGRPFYSPASEAADGPAPRVEHPRWPGRFVSLTTPLARGDDIAAWQRRMIELGYDLGSGGPTGKGDDGIFGERSFFVLKQFQAEHGLEIDGVLGPSSWAAAWVAKGG